MRNSDADIAIDVLNKLIANEYEAASAGQRYGNRPLEESASIRYHAYLNARDKIREALADAMEERDALNPFLPQRDELVTQDMHTCDLCGRRVSSPVYALHLVTYTTDRDAWTLTLNNAGTLESLLSEGWSVVRTDVLPGLNGKGEYKVPPNTCFEPSLPPTLVYILGKEAE